MTHRRIWSIRHIPAKVLVHVPGGGNINLFHPGLNLRFVLVMSPEADVEELGLLTLVHAVGRGQNVLVGDQGSPAVIPVIKIIRYLSLLTENGAGLKCI